MTHRLNRRQCLALLPALASPRVPAATATVDETWVDEARRRGLPLRIRWPEGETAAAVVLFSHGLGGSREGAEVWGRAWVQAGFVVVHLQHAGSDAAVLRGGHDALRAAMSAEQLLARVGDVRFLLDDIERRARLTDTPWVRTRGQALGLAGHSFGARTTQAVAGQRFAVPVDLSDRRPRAFIAFSPSLGAAALPPRQQFAAVTRPFLSVTGSHDGDPFGAYRSGEPRAAVHEALPVGARALLWLQGADHATFAGNAEPRIGGRGLLARRPGALEAEPRHHDLAARITTLWWQAHLRADRQALQALQAVAHGPGPPDLAAGDRWSMD